MKLRKPRRRFPKIEDPRLRRQVITLVLEYDGSRRLGARVIVFQDGLASDIIAVGPNFKDAFSGIGNYVDGIMVDAMLGKEA